MKILKPKIEYPKEQDVDRIVDIMRERGYTIEESDAYQIWSEWSNAVEANWLQLPEEDDILVSIILNSTKVMN